jgi:GTPase SAR1 family protein
VGDIGTGKTAIIRRCVENQFSESYKTTIGVDFALKTIQRSNATIHLQLWCASSPLGPLLFRNRF